jgi:hypothetical protein
VWGHARARTYGRGCARAHPCVCMAVRMHSAYIVHTCLRTRESALRACPTRAHASGPAWAYLCPTVVRLALQLPPALRKLQACTRKVTLHNVMNQHVRSTPPSFGGRHVRIRTRARTCKPLRRGRAHPPPPHSHCAAQRTVTVRCVAYSRRALHRALSRAASHAVVLCILLRGSRLGRTPAHSSRQRWRRKLAGTQKRQRVRTAWKRPAEPSSAELGGRAALHRAASCCSTAHGGATRCRAARSGRARARPGAARAAARVGDQRRLVPRAREEEPGALHGGRCGSAVRA